MKLSPLLLCLALSACQLVDESDWNEFDADGDGYLVDVTGQGEDCDDSDPAVHPGASESCNGIDDDCDGVVDDGVLELFYADADADGWGNPAYSVEACEAPSGYVADSGTGLEDCDDGDADSYPGAPELCDDADNDCDGQTDEAEDISWQDWYRDSDGDGFGDASDTINHCAQPSGFVADDQDCDDGDDAIHPDATELCDHLDNDCDGLTDLNDEDLEGDWTWHPDADGDGHGDGSVVVGRCEQPAGYVLADDDCDDSRATIHPDAQEICSGLDEDCDGLVDLDDPDIVEVAIWYADSDGDGYGLDSDTQLSCTAPAGYAALGGDCDDADPAFHPSAAEHDCDDPADYNCDGYAGRGDNDGDGFAACEECDDGQADTNPDATELCDGHDDDCDGFVDEDDAADASAWYADADSDGYGDPASNTTACSAPAGYVLADKTTDCDDSRAATHPGASEWCNGRDDDCDGSIDEDEALDAQTWYADSDGDGYGDGAASAPSCQAPSDHVAHAGDCDDADSAVHPGASEADCHDPVDYNCDGSTGFTDADGDGWIACEDCDDSRAVVSPDAIELCDGHDDDCDGSIDEGDAADALTWYSDADGDGHGDPASAITACTAPDDAVASASDCDDSRASSHPGASERCDGLDNDCDGDTDEDDAVDASTWYADTDADGFGRPALTTSSCSQPSGYTADASDCDDDDASAFPGAPETCDGVDNDCDGTADEDDAVDASTWYADADFDGYGDPGSSDTSCAGPLGYVGDSSDCDDSSPSINPSAPETCDGVDNDCDGETDEDDAVDATTWYADVDGDGWGDGGGSAACTQPSGTAAVAGDCDEAEPGINPGAAETCDGRDEDCDGSVDEDDAVDAPSWYADADADGYGDPGSASPACTQPSGSSADSSDCDDGDPSIHPGADEHCDGIDEDCDGEIDDDVVDGTTFYVDADGDGYGDPDNVAEACTATSGFTTDSSDCDDSDPAIFPGAPETWNGVDDDCDGAELQVVQAAAGAFHTLALLEDGSLWAWGSNNSGQLGDGSTERSTTPTQVTTPRDVVAIAAGYSHSLAVLDDGTLWTWGENGYGQLGVGGSSDKTSPTQVTSVSDAHSVAAGFRHSVVSLGDGTVWAMGENGYGQLGDGTGSDSALPVQVAGLTGIEAVAAGHYHALAQRDDGSLWAWGSNGYGQLGNSSTLDTDSPVQVSGLSDVQSVTAGASHSMAVETDGSIWTWGANNAGQLGLGSGSAGFVTSPTTVTTIWGGHQVAAGVYFSAVVLDDGSVWSWGDNSVGQIGDGTTTRRHSPVAVQGLFDAGSVAAGSSHALAITQDGGILAWGANSSGQLGDGTIGNAASPRVLEEVGELQSLIAGRYHSLGLDPDGTIVSWGLNTYGQVGNGETASTTTPMVHTSLAGGDVLGGGYNHTLAATEDGQLWSWGYNQRGQLGDGSTTDSSVPIAISGPSWVTSLAAGANHSLAIDQDGDIWSWGANSNGELGDGTNTDSHSPFELAGTGTALMVAAGEYHSMAMLDDGSVWTWGLNSSGQLGDGSGSPSNVPVELTSICSAKDIDVGAYHSLALCDDGSVWAWGLNGDGELGDGTTTNSDVPVEVTGLGTAVDIAAGGFYSLAVLDDGSLWAWGSNGSGQLGDGTTEGSTTPVEVTTLSDVVSISAGGRHTLAMVADGTAYGWGDTNYGQLGYDTWTPQQVSYPD